MLVRSQKPEETKRAADEVHKEGIEVFAVGVTEDINQEELKAIASHDDNKHVYNLHEFEDFEHFITEIQKRFSEGRFSFLLD